MKACSELSYFEMYKDREISVPLIGALLATHNPNSYITGQIESIMIQVGEWRGGLLVKLKFKRTRENMIQDFAHRICWTLRNRSDEIFRYY